MMRRAPTLAALTALALMAVACSSTAPSSAPTSAQRPAKTSPSSTAAPQPGPSTVSSTPKPVTVASLGKGERWIDLPMPGGAYTPQAPAGGTDDYRCILLDPHLRKDAFLSGVVLQPGNPALVHHAILYRVDPDQVAAAKARDASDPRLGWSCFGGPGIGSAGDDAIGQLDAAPWVAAFATSGGEQRFATGTGQKIAAGSRIVLQMHYNLLNGVGTDTTSVRLRVASAAANLTPLHTYLLPAPVELPCPANQTGPLCNRDASVRDVARRFGAGSGLIPTGLQLLCGGSVSAPRAGPTQSCTRPVSQAMTIRSVAGHMHLLGRAISVDLLHSDGTSRRLLDIKVWNFDDQRAQLLAHPAVARPGDQLKVTCTHDATLREKLPELQKLPPRYVVWGEGSSDEMCLAIIGYTS